MNWDPLDEKNLDISTLLRSGKSRHLYKDKDELKTKVMRPRGYEDADDVRMLMMLGCWWLWCKDDGGYDVDDVKEDDDADQLGGGGRPPGSAQTERRGECSEEHRPCSEIVIVVIFCHCWWLMVKIMMTGRTMRNMILSHLATETLCQDLRNHFES